MHREAAGALAPLGREVSAPGVQVGGCVDLWVDLGWIWGGGLSGEASATAGDRTREPRRVHSVSLKPSPSPLRAPQGRAKQRASCVWHEPCWARRSRTRSWSSTPQMTGMPEGGQVFEVLRCRRNRLSAGLCCTSSLSCQLCVFL